MNRYSSLTLILEQVTKVSAYDFLAESKPTLLPQSDRLRLGFIIQHRVLPE